MFRRVFCDIETLPPPKETLAKFPKICDCDEEQFRRLALSSDYGRILAISVIIECDGKVVQSGCLGRDRETRMFHLSEERLLRGFWRQLNGFDINRDLIIVFNGISFDLPFIYKRSIINRVRPSVMLPFTRYRSAPIFDVMQEWNKWDQRKFISLDELARILGLKSSKEDGMDGSQVYDRFCAGAHEDLAEYCLADARVTRNIWYRMVYPEGPEPEGE
jgi:3'-5' exonuclease